MKKGLKIGLVFGTLLMLIALMFSGNATSNCIPRQNSDLIAGQDHENPAGYVEAYILSGTYLVVIYKAYAPWTLTETHLWVGDDWNDMPHTKKGNPKIGHFPYKDNDDGIYVVPLPADANGDGEILIVAHAIVGYQDGCEWNEETAWANTGNLIPGASSWALYFPFEV